MNRRRFFREGLREMLRPLGSAIDKFADVAKQISDLDNLANKPAPPPPAPQTWMRPPGAVSESLFPEMCRRSGECVRVCPVQAIKIDPSAYKGKGAPYIDADEQACVVCDGLHCTSACPTGALVTTARDNIRMGSAIWHEDTCLRREGGSCTICVDRCPLGSVAIALREGRIEVIDAGCIGCGVCQHDCPTYPKSITVIPRS